jgi:methyl-accepting chemotaxis protein
MHTSLWLALLASLCTLLSSLSALAPALSARSKLSEPTAQDVGMRTREFAANFSNDFNIDATQSEKVGSTVIPLLKNGDLVLNRNQSVDSFATRTQGIATIFVKVESQFIRISSSLDKDQSSHTYGTTLDADHPAYKHLINGLNYMGKVAVAGKYYRAKYQLIRDQKGLPVGALMIGLPT